MRVLVPCACALLSVLPVTVMAQGMQEQSKCASIAAPPSALAGWSRKIAVTAAANEDGLSSASLAVDRAADVTLHATHEVTYLTQPDKPGGSVAHGGLLAVTIASAGTYQINLSSGAWIDLVRGGQKILSTAHAPGPNCTGIRKTVQFPLPPGRYVVQISANADPTVAIMVSRVP